MLRAGSFRLLSITVRRILRERAGVWLPLSPGWASVAHSQSEGAYGSILAPCHHRVMAESVAQYGRRTADGDPMSADNERLLDRITERIDRVAGRIHDRMDGIGDRLGRVEGKVDALAGQVADNGAQARGANDRLARLEAKTEPDDGKTGTATVAMKAIGAVESKPWLMIGFVVMFAIAAAAWVLTR